MRKDSAIQLLPSFKMQLKDAKVIFCIVSLSILAVDTMLLLQSEGWKMVAYMSVSILAGLFVCWSIPRFLLTLLKSDNTLDYYIGALLAFVLVVVTLIPVCIYLFIDQQWELLNEYGTECFSLFNRYVNWIIPIAVFLMVSCTYWLIIHYIQKESMMFYLLEKKKKEIYG